MATVSNSTSVPSTSVPSPSAPSSSAPSSSALSSSAPPTLAPVTTRSGISKTSATASLPAISSTQLATSTATSKPAHTAIDVDVGIGAGVGVAVGLAILAAGYFYHRRHIRSKTQGKGPRAMGAVSNSKSDDRQSELHAEALRGELPADETPQELIPSKGPHWELDVKASNE